MTENPYRPTSSESIASPSRRAVGRYMVTFWLLFLISAPVAAIGLYLLNEELQWIPTLSGITDFSINGRTISNTTVMYWSLGLGMLVFIASVCALLKAFRNWRYNKRLTSRFD